MCSKDVKFVLGMAASRQIMHYCCLESGILASSQQTCLVGSCQHPSHACSQRTGGQGQGQSLSARPSSSLGGRLVKTLQKTKQREDKRQDKKEARVSGQFAKCMSTYYERTLKEERDFVFSKLAKHDSWMPKLAAVFRSGALEKLLSMEAEQSKQLADEELANENGVELGFRVTGRVTKLFKLPKDTKARLLEDWFECNSFPDNEEHINVDCLNLVLSFVLHVSPKTNVPPVPNNRFENVLSKQFELRAQFLKEKTGFLRLGAAEGQAVQKLQYGDRSRLRFYFLETTEGGQGLGCGFLGKKVPLPKLHEGTWVLSSEHDFEALVHSSTNNAMILICASFFDKELKDLNPDDTWMYDEAPAAAAAASSQLVASEPREEAGGFRNFGSVSRNAET